MSDAAAPGPEAARARLPVVRVRHRCPDAREFRARYARAIANDGIFVPTARKRAVGTRVELALELRDQTVIRGEAIAVDPAPADAGRTGTTFRFVRLEEGSLEYEEAPPRPEAPPVVAAAAIPVAPIGRVAIAPAASAAPGAPGGPEAPAADPTSLDDLFSPEEQREIFDGPAVDEPTGEHEPEPTIEVPLREDVLETRATMDAASAAATADRRGRARRSRARLLAAAGAFVGVVALGSYLVAGSRTSQALDAELRVAEERLADGRLAGGGDSALDHLVAARGLAADDARVQERLRLVADKLEQLAESALARGDYAEAAVHLTAATQADPGRRSLHERLGDIARGRAGARQDGVSSTPTR